LRGFWSRKWFSKGPLGFVCAIGTSDRARRPEQPRGQFEQKGGGTRMGRGDVRTAVLALLAE
jgi:hypothetical protein